jgi:hypothetical protein
VIRSDFEHFGGIWQAVNFVEYDAAATQPVQESLSVFQHSSHARKFAVEIFGVGQSLTQTGLANAANSRQPHYRSLPPGSFNQVEPEMPAYHMLPR